MTDLAKAATERPAKAKGLTPAEATEDRNRRMAIAAARRDRAESAAYHLAAQGHDGEYLPDGNTWDALGLARLATRGLGAALKAYRTAQITPDTWQDVHGAIVTSALAKAAEAEAAAECMAEACQAAATWATPGPGPDYLTCMTHRPPLYVTRQLPERMAPGTAYTETRVTEDADGNVTVAEVTVTPRVKRPAEARRIHLGRNLHRPSQGPAVARVNLAWAIERAKGLLANHWAGEAIPTPWEAEDADAKAADAKAAKAAEAEAAEAWASAVTWQDVAPHLGATTPAECMALDLALTDGLERAEAGAKATAYGAKAPMGAEAAKKATQRAYKALAARITPEDVRAAILAAVAEEDTAEAASPEAAAILAPATMANRRVTVAEARAGLAEVLNPKALRSAFIARHLWPMRPTRITPGRGRHAVALAPCIVAEDGGHALILAPTLRPYAEARRMHAEARHLAQADARRMAAIARAQARVEADPMAAYAEAWARVDEAEATAAQAAAESAPGLQALAQVAAKAAKTARQRAMHLTTCRVPRARPARAITQAEAIGPHRPLAQAERPWPAIDTARHERTQAAKAQATPAATPEATQAAPLAGADLPEAWRMTGPNGPMHARPLTPAEAKAQATAKAAAAAERATWPQADQAAHTAKAEAQMKRAKARAKRAKAAAKA